MRFVLSAGFIVVCSAMGWAAPPTVLDSRLTVQLIAEQPLLVTPTGVAVDKAGRIFVLENHTHQTAAGYQGPKADRIRVFEEFDATGRAGKVTTFAEGFRDGMSLAFDRENHLYLATRKEISRWVDGKQVPLVRLETKGNYPHNGLCGFAWDLNGDLIFGLGENLGESYSVIGSDGSKATGGGEGGSMYRCRPDGAMVSRIATGFWNPYGHCVDAQGRLFAVDNDPDARGPCRLLHVIQGGDYGYRFRYGRKGTHPFQSWNGELPGTLPMTAGTSEAPSGVIPGEFTSLPADFAGDLLITSWGDHTIERFHLQNRGASLVGAPRIVVRGDENFRPVAFAIAPDGSVVFTDWVKKDYPVHGHGRLWRLSANAGHRTQPKPQAAAVVHPEEAWHRMLKKPANPAQRLQAMLHLKSPQYLGDVVPALGDSDPFIVAAALEVLGRPGQSGLLRESSTPALKESPAWRTGWLLALRRTGDPDARAMLSDFIQDPDPGVRRAAIQWIGEERLKPFTDAIQAAAVRPPVTRDILEAWAKAQEMLTVTSVKGPNESADPALAALMMKSERSPETMSLALRMLPAESPFLPPAFLERSARSTNEQLVHDVLLTCFFRSDDRALATLQAPLQEGSGTLANRRLALAGLARFSDREPVQRLLLESLKNRELAADALRSLRSVPNQREAVRKWWTSVTVKTDPKKLDRDLEEQFRFTMKSNGSTTEVATRSPKEWRALLENGEGDAAAGERVFFHARGAGCYRCHRVENRGSGVGPDLTVIGRALNRDRLIESILDPSKEIAPMYTAWRVTTRDGKERVGLITETFDSMVTLLDAQGKTEKIRRTEIEERVAIPKSIMPDDLANQMTAREFLDLLAYLQSRK